VVEAIAQFSNSPVNLYGASYGAIGAFGAATLTRSINRLALYEGWSPVYSQIFEPPPGFLELVEARLPGWSRY
jgi:hypothetical protein